MRLVDFHKIDLHQEILIDGTTCGVIVHGDGDVAITLFDPRGGGQAVVARFKLKPPYYATRMEAAMAWVRVVLAHRPVIEVIDLLGGPEGPRVSPMAYAESLGWDWRGNDILAAVAPRGGAPKVGASMAGAAADPPVPAAAALPPPSPPVADRQRPLLPRLPMAPAVTRGQP